MMNFKKYDIITLVIGIRIRQMWVSCKPLRRQHHYDRKLELFEYKTNDLQKSRFYDIMYTDEGNFIQ